MNDQPVLLEQSGTIATILLNRPQNRNSMDHEVLPAFLDALGRVRGNSGIRCLIITGSGGSFCAGADFKGGFGVGDDLPMDRKLLAVYKHFLEVAEIEIPVIGALNGHAIGGGFGLALMCDIRIANRTALYGANFARLGIHSGMAISYLLPRLAGVSNACELLFTGRRISGDELVRMGLASSATDADEVLPKARDLAHEIAEGAPAAIRMMKRTLYRGLDWNPGKAAEIEARCQARTLEMDDAREGISALLEKRKPVFTGR